LIKRSLTVLVTALVLGIAGGTVASTASATVIAKEGHYSGHDHNGNHIGFQYSKAHGMQHFTIDYSFTIGGAHVNNAMWHETCHGGYCTSGNWSTRLAHRASGRRPAEPSVLPADSLISLRSSTTGIAAPSPVHLGVSPGQ